MFQTGDVLIETLPQGYYGAIKILKVEQSERENEDKYLIAATRYFDKEKPKITDPNLKKIAVCPGSGLKFIYVVKGSKNSIQTPKIRFEYLGNLPLTEKEQMLQPKDFHLMPHFPSLFSLLAPADVQETYRQEYEAKVTREAYRYLDDKNDKYFLIEYGGNERLFYSTGKTGTLRGYKHKVFNTEDTCIKEAQKLIDAKIKEGYVLATNHYMDDKGKHMFDDDGQEKPRQNNQRTSRVSLHG